MSARLIEAGMMYGSLKRIDEPHLVERYNRALAAMRISPTALDCFHIDASGYSLEVGAELDDLSYLDPRGVNRRFVIIVPEQRDLPLIRSSFTADADVLRTFFDANQRVIETLTLRDAIYGEIDNLVFDVRRVEDILPLRSVTFDVHTPNGVLKEARALEALVRRFEEDPESWRDLALQERIVDGAKRCGDIRRNAVIPRQTAFEWPKAFFTTHFGGAYVFHRPERTVVFGDPSKIPLLPIGCEAVGIGDAERVLAFVREERLAEPLNHDWLRRSGIVEQRFRAVVADVLARSDPGFQPACVLSDEYLNSWIHQAIDTLQADRRFAVLTEMRFILGNGGDIEGYVRSLPAGEQLMFRRALPEHPDAWETNRLVNEYALFDPLSLFIVNKPRFYQVFESFDDRMQDFAVAAVKSGYMPDVPNVVRFKQAVRERLFGLH